MSRRQLSPAAAVVVILLIPLAIPVLFVFLGPTADRARAQEPEPKPAIVPPLKTVESAMSPGSATRRGLNSSTRTKEVAAVKPLPKPSGKMEFVPDSVAPRATRPTSTARSAASAVARRQASPLPGKIAAVGPTPQMAPRLKAPSIRTLPAPVLEPNAEAPLMQVATKEIQIPDRERFETPEVVVTSPPEPPAQFSERPELPLAEFELPIVRAPQRPGPTLDDEFLDDEVMAPARSERDVVQPFFEEESAGDDATDENMELVEQDTNNAKKLVETETPIDESPQAFFELTTASEIQPPKAQENANVAKPSSDAVARDEDLQGPSEAVLAELKPVGSIEIRRAVELPPLAEMDNPQLREPADQARAVLRKRPPFRIWPVYRDPWTASRDSFAFHHNPLWFEDPNLERCGRGNGCFTSVASFLRFNANVAILPYRMTAEPPSVCVRTLPDCTVCQKFGYDAYLPPWSLPATAVQGGAIFGFIYAIP